MSPIGTAGAERSKVWQMLFPILCLLIGGCVATYHTRHGEAIETAPDAALVCRYNWSADEPLFRSENVYSYRWGPASSFGHHDAAAAVRDLTRACTAAAASGGRTDARISAYYLRYANKLARGAAAVPLAYASGFTLGFLPVPMTDHFAVCLEIAADGLRRTAMVRSQLDSFTNVWGTSNTRHHQGKDEARFKVDQIMREMTVHAWYKAWKPVSGGTGPTVGCRGQLDALVSDTDGDEVRP